jgi:spermidine/putrescine transport system substrate-binding protein
MTDGMRRRDLLRAGAGLAAGALLTGCGVGPQSAPEVTVQEVAAPKIDGDLLIFNWTEYMNPKVVKSFEKQYGVQVTTSNFDSMSGMMAKLRSGNRYDLIFPTADYVSRLNRLGALRPLDRAVLSNSDSIYPFFDDPWYDPASGHTVPYGMYTTGIAWRTDLAGELTGSWNDLATEAAKGRTFMLDDFQEAIGQANLLNGFELNTVDPAQLEQSQATLEMQKGFLRGYSTNPAPNLVSGTAWIHHAWNGDVINARNQSKHPEDIRFQTCSEGIPVGSDCMAIPANARHPGTATLFIDWMLDPEHASENVSWFGYPMPIKGTEDAFAKLASDDPEIQITTEDLAKGQQFRELPRDDKAAWDRIWTEVKA